MNLDFILTAILYTLIMVLLHIFLADANLTQRSLSQSAQHAMRSQRVHSGSVANVPGTKSILKRRNDGAESANITEITEDYLRYFEQEHFQNPLHTTSAPTTYTDALQNIQSEKTELDLFYEKMLLDQSYETMNFDEINREVNDVLPKKNSTVVTTPPTPSPTTIMKPPTVSPLNDTFAFDGIMAMDEYEQGAFGSAFASPF